VRALVRRAESNGARLLRGAAKPDGDRAVVDGRPLDADAVVWACGAWLGRLFPELLPLRVTFQQLVLFEAPPHWRGPGWVDFDAAFYGHCFVDPHGVKVAPDMDGADVDPDERPLEATAEAIQQASEYVAHRFPSLAGAQVARAPGCHYSLTPDAEFVFARHPEHGGVWLLGGGSGHGFKHGPALAEHAAAVLAGRVEPEPRFALAERKPARSLRTAGAD
jgi:sarcosine oxidase